MIVSVKHLNKFLPNLKLDPYDVEKAFNELGFEVESVRKFSDAEGVIFAEVLDVFKNENSDRLDVVRLKTKLGQLTIQTTNRILKVGDLVICFPEGSKKGEQVFKNVQLKGHPSQGMLASWSEIGYQWDLLEHADQLLVLPKNFAGIDDDPMQVLNIDDYIIEIAINANRNDANSYYVLALELAAYYQSEINFNLSDVKANFQSEFQASNGKADHLSFSEIHGNKQTSIYEKTLLAKHGFSSLFDWAVNLTNLTLLNIGVPVHVYDAKKINKSIVADLYTGEVEILGTKRIAVNDVLAIKDDDEVISLACVMGLETTKSSQATQEYLFEIGVFNPKFVRHGAKEIKLLSHSATQGSRIITPYLAALAMQYIRNYCSDLKVSQIINPIKVNPLKKITINENTLLKYAGNNDLKGFDLAIKKMQILGFYFKDPYFIIPGYRYDIEIFEDIIEEIFRFYSYKNFQPKSFKTTPALIHQRDINKSFFQHQGYTETRTFSLVSQQRNFLNIFNFKEDIKLLTYVSKEHECIRNSIITSLQEVVIYNQKRKISAINIFERGMINYNHQVFGLASTTKTFAEIKQDIINFVSVDLEFLPLKNNPFIHPNVSAYILYQKQIIGWLGKIHPKYDTTNAFYAEFYDLNFKTTTKFKAINTNPLKTLDLTFELLEHQNMNEIINDIKQCGEIYQIIKIDDFQKEHCHNITLRITAYDTVIETLNQKFNK
ncbi:phenylalanyl-tRNA synthetase beta chain [Mycoplasmopsis mustelae]|uniref:phenylalanine--tRNA ligase n=1 Tax=Mycoplasmopsis mustelae TaxID=171289 RepID=A0A4R7UC28_9BACT|nr:phenylalanine--tRNA ligase subunit beta [Mycoplasmopsis mustelae]TDV23062.1 phenylalanyl-tRNA synthetase beta chain [Mycoplasmopsis mustelae]